MKSSIMFLILLTFLFQLARTKDCPSICKDVICIGETSLIRFCRQGIVKDSCECCYVCRKSEGDSCGGYMDVHGKCGHGLHCHNKFCMARKIIGSTGKAPVKKCRPKCSVEFCAANPNAICSADTNKKTTRKDQGCQGPCRHTSCSACFVRKRGAKCPKCRQRDFPCMLKFAMCLRKNVSKVWRFDTLEKGKKHKVHCNVPLCD